MSAGLLGRIIFTVRDRKSSIDWFVRKDYFYS